MITMQISGRLTKDMDVREKNSKTYGLFSVASSHWDSKAKEYVSDYIDCLLFGERVHKLSEKLHKGVQVVVAGEFQTRLGTTDPKKIFSTLMVSMIDIQSKAEAKKPEDPRDDDLPFDV